MGAVCSALSRTSFASALNISCRKIITILLHDYRARRRVLVDHPTGNRNLSIDGGWSDKRTYDQFELLLSSTVCEFFCRVASLLQIAGLVVQVP